MLIVKSEHPFHHLPLLVAPRISPTALQLRYERLPLCLTRKGGKTVHRWRPIEILRSIDNHHQASTQDIDLHLEDSNCTDAFAYLTPMKILRVPLTILANHIRIIAKVECLHIAFHPTLTRTLYIAIHSFYQFFTPSIFLCLKVW